MEYDQALSQISEIHRHLTRNEVYRDVRALPVAASGLLALAAGALQPALIGGGAADIAFIFYWVGLAVICAGVSGAPILYNYLASGPQQRRRTHVVAAQFAPCLAAGAIATVAFAPAGSAAIRWLPGVWALLFSLGIFAARPYLPKAIGFVGLFYLLAAGLALRWQPGQAVPLGYCVGATFGIGQLAAGAVLYWNLERKRGL